MPNNSRFKVAPSDMMAKRSRFEMLHNHKTTGNFGELLPFYCEEVLPGDTFKIDSAMLSRMSTPLYPTMDNAWINYYYFFVPNRLVWSHFAEFLGENKDSAWVANQEYFIPHDVVKSSVGCIADHFGIPTYSDDLIEEYSNMVGEYDINVLPFRAYALIWNEWFRNENTTDPLLVNTGDDVVADEFRYITGSPLKVSLPFDVFTSALPAPQKGDAIDIPFLQGDAMVITTDKASQNAGMIPMRFNTLADTTDTNYNTIPLFLNVSPTVAQMDYMSQTVPGTNGVGAVGSPLNLALDKSTVDPVTINLLRQAFSMQRLLELQARSGSRYTEIIRASFGVVSPDARLQRPEYLGGSKVQIQMQQVLQQSATSEESPLGHTGAYSKTSTVSSDVNFSATEHGFIIGVACARYEMSYQQGLAKMWSRRGRFDLYWPAFANIGEQPIYQKEIYATGDDDEDEKVFGYQEAWYEYRNHPNLITGMFRSTVNQNLDEWHYAEHYKQAPILNDTWMSVSPTVVDRTLAVTSDLHHQLLFDFRLRIQADRVMPLYSIPGLIRF